LSSLSVSSQNRNGKNVLPLNRYAFQYLKAKTNGGNDFVFKGTKDFTISAPLNVIKYVKGISQALLTAFATGSR